MEATGGPVDALLTRQHAAARERLPPDLYDYYACGAGDELAASEAVASWQELRLRPRVLRDVAAVDLESTLLGSTFASPVGIAPTAFHRLAHPAGEVATAAGASAAGSLMVVSTRASMPLEEIAGATTHPWWFQVYVMRDRALTQALVARAVECGAKALVLTGDTPYVGAKARVDGVRFAVPETDFVVNLARHLPPGADVVSAAAQDPSVTEDAIRWLSSISGLPVLVKGLLRADDALRCVSAGASGVVVSNHGGRQLSRALPTASALVEVVDAVAGSVPVLVDGGLRTGMDVLVALALGADAVLLGRPVLWALAAEGAAGVESLLKAVAGDLAHGLALLGERSPRGLDRTSVWSG